MKNVLSYFLVFLLCCCALAFAQDGESSLQKELAELAQEERWLRPTQPEAITREDLVKAIELARCYYINHQNESGNFTYGLDLANGDEIKKDNQVRQAGALWGLSSLNRERCNEPTRRAVLLGINFFAGKVNVLKNGRKCFIYPGEKNISSGAVALYCLALTEFLVGQDRVLAEKDKALYRQLLDIHLAFLQGMELPDGSWARAYNQELDFVNDDASPYYDGEALLAYCKAARYLGYDHLLPRINEALPKLIRRYTVECWASETDRELCKGFYQWGCMAFAEYVEAGWQPHAILARHAAYALSWWLIHVNQLVNRNGNTAYAVEGLIGAWRIARTAGDTAQQAAFRKVIDDVMAKVMVWQYKGPFMKYNPVLSRLKDVPAGADGGITMSLNDTLVRIDTVQHQLHAMLLMLNHVVDGK